MERQVLEATRKTEARFNLDLRFRAHEVSNYVEDKRQLEDIFREAFVLGDKNIYLAESMGTSSSNLRDYQRGFNKYGSYQMACAYMYQKHLIHEAPTDAEVRRGLRTLEKEKETNSQTAFIWAGQEIVDEMRAEGYDIEIVMENPTEMMGLTDYNLGSLSTLDDFKFRLRRIATHTQKRDKTLRQQVVDLSKKASKNPGNTNVLVLLGTVHSRVAESLPQVMRQDMFASCEISKLDDHPIRVMMLRVTSGLQVEESEWQSTFQYIEENGLQVSFGQHKP